MATYGHILKNWKKHSPEKLFSDSAMVSFRINAMFNSSNVKKYHDDGSFAHTSIGIIDGSVSVSEDNEKSFIFHIEGVNLEDINIGLDHDFDYLVPNENLCSLAYIENVNRNNSKLVFEFVYEYLKINQDEYCWFEWDFVFSWKDLQVLAKTPFAKNWYAKPL